MTKSESDYSNLSEEDKERSRTAAKNYYQRNKKRCLANHRAWYERNKEVVRQKQKEFKRQRKLEAINYLGGKCHRCDGVFHPSIYEFHHIDPATKERDPSKYLFSSWNRITEELDKCQLLCANCHRLVHHGENY